MDQQRGECRWCNSRNSARRSQRRRPGPAEPLNHFPRQASNGLIGKIIAQRQGFTSPKISQFAVLAGEIGGISGIFSQFSGKLGIKSHGIPDPRDEGREVYPAKPQPFTHGQTTNIGADWQAGLDQFMASSSAIQRLLDAGT